jgi:hypothetical protein
MRYDGEVASFERFQGLQVANTNSRLVGHTGKLFDDVRSLDGEHADPGHGLRRLEPVGFAGLRLEKLFAVPKPFTALWHYTPAFCGQRPLASDAFSLILDCTPDCMIWSWELITKLRAR